MTNRDLLLGGLALLAGALTASSASASDSATTQNPGDWLAWHGCWRAEGADVDELLCIVPDGAGVRMITVQGDAIVAESRVVTDGRSYPVRHDDCNGAEQASWSADGRRVFLTSDLVCGGDVRRKVSGIFVFAGANEWLSVQSVTVGDRTATRTVRYQAVEPSRLPGTIAPAVRANRNARMAARQDVLRSIQEADVDEALNRVDAIAVNEWLRATDQPFQVAGYDDDVRGDVHTSALEQVGGASNRVTYTTREVVVVERPTTVHRTYVTHVVRSCWDPFLSGYVTVRHGVTVGLSYGDGYCGRRYYSRYSPWGYDIYGWRIVNRPILVVRNRPVIIRTGSRYHNDRHETNWRDRSDDRDRGRVTRDGYSRDGRSSRDDAARDRDRDRGDSGSWQRDRDRPARTDSRDREPVTRTESSRERERARAAPPRTDRESSRSSGERTVRQTRSAKPRN